MSYSDFNWIDHRIAIGGFVTEPEALPFDAVLSMETQAPIALRELVQSGRVDYQWRPIIDGVCYETHEDIVRRFDDAADQIHAWVSEDRTVLVHCFAGVSRSVTAVIWYLMRYENMSWDQALEHIRRERVMANPNIRFAIPLRIAAGEPFDHGRLAQQIDEWIAFVRQDGWDVDAQEIWQSLEEQGTLRHVPTPEAVS